jgi:hypothetical protein
MHGSLALARGVLFVGTQAKTAHVRTYDLGGRPLATSFSFRDASAGRSAVSGLSVDADRSVWVADEPASRVRVFSVFGRETRCLGDGAATEEGPPAVLPGLIERPVDVVAHGGRDDGWVAIACGGERLHAVQVLEPDLTLRASLPSRGDPRRPFRGVRRIAARGELLAVAEAGARLVQVFRANEFLFAFALTDRQGEAYEPSALAPLEDGRMLVACRAPESALFLVDPSGRPLARLAEEGEDEGRVLDPSDVVVDEGAEDRDARVFVLDADGLRLQAFDLGGRCLGRVPLDEPARSAHPSRSRGAGARRTR